MKEKVKRILDLVRGGKLTLEDAAPLLAALSSRLALTDSDRELVASLLAREELDTGQVAEHLLLLRGLRDSMPSPPPPPQPPRRPQVVIGGSRVRGLDDLGDRLAARIEQVAAQFAGRAERFGEDVEAHMDRFADELERAVEGSAPRSGGRGPSARILRIQVESQHGDEYSANIPVSLAGHLDRLIPPHGQAALESAGFTLDALRLLIEASPGPGPLIDAEDQHGNEVHISLK
ncbi:hypothetical protein HNQ07_001790 [Deinococcus metalli]|uniref:YvlB/LiaX N-terminal domain-containing protein n=1 Tax=Deinococcus metalli TaxID=1141878 RepID=A0A7W8KEL2_9DEIO|nr:hypothetical protein [Deinococcus metalli]MBB5376333.1 hypothetical protein [Deinococcus metalli]GHF39074.1 hypothetical protein GCM10017781_14490 [Deinococcus metalli]